MMVLDFQEGGDYSGFWSSRAAWLRIGSTEQGKGNPPPREAYGKTTPQASQEHGHFSRISRASDAPSIGSKPFSGTSHLSGVALHPWWLLPAEVSKSGNEMTLFQAELISWKIYHLSTASTKMYWFLPDLIRSHLFSKPGKKRQEGGEWTQKVLNTSNLHQQLNYLTLTPRL